MRSVHVLKLRREKPRFIACQMSWHRLPPGHADSMWRNPGRCIVKSDPSISPTHPGFEGTELILWRYRVRGTGTVWSSIAVYMVVLAKR